MAIFVTLAMAQEVKDAEGNYICQRQSLRSDFLPHRLWRRIFSGCKGLLTHPETTLDVWQLLAQLANHYCTLPIR